MANFNDFCDVVKSYHLFCDVELYEIIGSEKSCDDIIYEIYRNIHTFKGDFCIFELCSIVEKLHILEDEILHFKNEAKGSKHSLCDGWWHRQNNNNRVA
jgi:chemotaxis protein histidine kinase CheA